MYKRYGLVLICLLALLLAACGGSTPAEPTVLPPTEGAAAPTVTQELAAAATETPEEDGATVGPTAEATSTVEEEAETPTPEAEAIDLAAFSEPTECEVDLTGQEITMYHFGDLSGAFALVTQPLVAGLEDAIEVLNADGGICGATLKQEFADTAGRQEEAQAIYERYAALDPKPRLLLLYSSADMELLRDQTAEDEIPVLSAGVSIKAVYGEDGQSPGWAYGTLPLYVDQFGLFCNWVAENWEGEEPPKVGHLNWEGAFGRSTDTPLTREYCAAQGVEVVGAEYFLPGSPDVTTQIQTLQASGANIIYTTALASGPAQVLKDAIAIGERENLMIAGVNWALDTTTVALAQQAAEGLIGPLPYLWWDDTDSPGIQLITEQWTAKGRAPDTRNVGYIQAWAAVDLYRELLTRAANEAGDLASVDGPAIKAQLDELQYAPMGIVLLDYTDGRRTPHNARIARVTFTDGQPRLEALTEELETPSLHPGGADAP
ncbi:MAG: ABC transporter substrate-binding protein [Ardenticatenales bacterium]|nr:ABC transporter substrate-binding protein [Ardenticatenales bacterium]